eukprot:gene25950-biopygen12127
MNSCHEDQNRAGIEAAYPDPCPPNFILTLFSLFSLNDPFYTLRCPFRLFSKHHAYPELHGLDLFSGRMLFTTGSQPNLNPSAFSRTLFVHFPFVSIFLQCRSRGSALLKEAPGDRQLRFQLDPGREHPPRDM